MESLLYTPYRHTSIALSITLHTILLILLGSLTLITFRNIPPGPPARVIYQDGAVPTVHPEAQTHAQSDTQAPIQSPVPLQEQIPVSPYASPIHQPAPQRAPATPHTKSQRTTAPTPSPSPAPPQGSLREQWHTMPLPGSQYRGDAITAQGVSLKQIMHGFTEYTSTVGLPDGDPDGHPLGLLQDYAYDRKVFMLAQGVCQKWRISRPPLMLRKPLYLTRVTIHTIVQRDGTVIKRSLDPSTGDSTMDRYIYELFDTIGLYPRIPDHFDRDIYVHSFSFAVRLPAGASHPEFYFGKYHT